MNKIFYIPGHNLHRYILAILLVLASLTSFAQIPNNNNYIKIDTSGLNDVKDFVVTQPFTSVDLYTRPPIVKVMEDRGRMYVNATQLRMSYEGDLIGNFYSDANGSPVIEWDWDKWSHLIDSSPWKFFDYSFNCLANGTARFQIELSNTEKENIHYVEIPLSKLGRTGLSFRMDGIYPDMFDSSSEWLYGKVSEGVLTGEFAVEKFDGEAIVGNKTYHILKRCDSNEYNPDEAYEIAYIRYDGVRPVLLPINVELPKNIWCSGMKGTVNPAEILGTDEIPLLDVYNSTNRMSFKDILLNQIDIRSMVEVNYHFGVDAMKYFNSSSAGGVNAGKSRNKLICQVNLNGDIKMVEGIGYLGNCANSLAYPSMAGKGSGGVQKLIMMKSGDSFSGPIQYEDEDLMNQYGNYLSDVKEIPSDVTDKIIFDGENIYYYGDGDVAISIIAIDGTKVKEYAGHGNCEILPGDLSSGIYLVSATSKGGTHYSKKIYIK